MWWQFMVTIDFSQNNQSYAWQILNENITRRHFQKIQDFFGVQNTMQIFTKM